MLTARLFNLPKTPWNNPFAEFDRMRKDMDALSNHVFGRTASTGHAGSGVFPLLNVTENKDNYFIRAELPGIKPTDLDIQIAGNKLTLSGARNLSAEGEEAKYHRREREAGKFSRILELPEDVDPEKVAAKSENGVLTVTIPKAEKTKPRQITIN